MPVYNWINYSDSYSKASGNLWQHYRNEPALTDSATIENLPGNSAWFKSKARITGKTPASGNTKDVEYLSNFWKTLEMCSVNCEISFCHYRFKWWEKICNNWYKTLSPSRNFMNSR